MWITGVGYWCIGVTVERSGSVSQEKVGRNEEIRALRAEGKSLREIAVVFGLTRQRVHQIVGQVEVGEVLPVEGTFEVVRE